MRFCLAFLLAPLAAIAGTWWWLGAPVAMPPSPLAEGARLYCVSYAPFRGAQSPLDGGTHIPAQQIEEDLRNLAKLTDCVRTYSIEHGLDQVPAIAARYGLQVMQGLWLSSDRIRNEQQIAAVIDLVNKHKNVVRSLVVGNEVLLRGEMSGQDLAAVMRRVKAAVQVPVTYADVWEFWLRHPELRDAADFVTVHILPYWEDFPIPAEQAAAHVDSIRAKVVEAFPDKQVLIGETGWPSAGRMREGALPSPVNEALVMHEILAAAARGGYRVNLIEAFDQPWKRRLEGTAGGYWGLFDENRVVKFAWGQPVSDHPHWKLQAAGGLALAAIVFASAWWAAGTASRRRNDAMLWGMVAVMAAVSGIFVGWTVEKAAYESLGAGGWVRSAALLFVGVAAPIVAATLLAGRFPLPRFADVLGPARARLPMPALAAGLVLVVLSAIAMQVMLGFVFDPRYRDFPFAALAGAVVPFALVALRRERRRMPAGMAEKVSALVLALAAVYVFFNEGTANWQSLATVACVALLSLTLLRGAGEPETE